MRSRERGGGSQYSSFITQMKWSERSSINTRFPLCPVITHHSLFVCGTWAVTGRKWEREDERKGCWDLWGFRCYRGGQGSKRGLWQLVFLSLFLHLTTLLFLTRGEERCLRGGLIEYIKIIFMSFIFTMFYMCCVSLCISIMCTHICNIKGELILESFRKI